MNGTGEFLLTSATTLVTMNGSREVLTNAWVAARDGLVTEVGTGPVPELLDGRPSAGRERFDAAGCVVLLDGQPVNSCVVAAARAHGRQVTTLEGLAGDPLLKQLQEALVEHAGIQCGYCTPGMLVSLLHLMRESRATGAQPDDHAIREALSGNLCRCTGYVKPVAAAAAVAAALSTIPASGTEAS